MNLRTISVICVSSLMLSLVQTGRGQGGRMLARENLDGLLNAPEFPGGLDWLNTSTPLRVKDLRGKFVLLDFWTFCCINCMHILPDLRKLETKYNQELVVIGVHSAKFKNEKDTSQIRQAILRYRIQHPVVNDAGFEIWQSYSANSWPTLILINPLGKVIGKISGEGIYEPLDQVLSQAIPCFEKKGQLKRSPLNLTLEQARKANTLLEFPGKISADQEGGRLFISDSSHNRILVVDADGKILDLIGSGSEGRGDGPFEEAQFLHPQGTFLSGSVLYIADTENHLIRAADLGARRVTTVLGNVKQASYMSRQSRGLAASLNSPWDLLIHGGSMYIAMAGSHQLWVADLPSWDVRPYAGSGREDIKDAKLAEASLAQPSGITTDGKNLYFADSETSSIRAADLDPNGRVRTIVGQGLFEFGDMDGGSSTARLQHPLGVAFHDGLVYVADTYNSKIKTVDPIKGSVRTLAGSGKKTLADGRFRDAAFNEPGGLAWLNGKLYVADTNNHQIRVLDPVAKSVAGLELTGLEKLSRRQMGSFRGRLIDLGEREVKAGAAQLALNVVLPEGYKFNAEAPFFMRWSTSSPGTLTFDLQSDTVDFKRVKFPLDVPIRPLDGQSEVTIDTIVYYCTAPSSACYVDPIRVKLSLKASPVALAVVPVDIAVKRP